MLTINIIIHGGVKVYYFSQLIVHGDFINSLSPFESGFLSSIQDAGLHGSVQPSES